MCTEYIRDIHFYFRLNSRCADIANSLRVEMLRQSWSLQGRQLPLCLFSKRYVDEDEKSEIAAKIATMLPPITGDTLPRLPIPKTIAKPTFPAILDQKKLVDFVTPESLIFFASGVKDWRWILKPPASWENDSGFLASRSVVEAITTVNDGVERLCGVAKRYRVSK